MLQIHVNDFGPIADGTVELRPLTIFAGPNNSGKSYLAMLIYGILHAGSPRFGRPMARSISALRSQVSSRFPAPWELFADLTAEAIQRHSEELVAWLPSLEAAQAHPHLQFANLPRFVQEVVESSLRETADSYLEDLASELKRCFGTEVDQLRRRLEKPRSFRISVTQSDPTWRFTMVSKAKNRTDHTSDVDASRVVAVPAMGRRSPYDLSQSLRRLRDAPEVPPSFFDMLRAGLGELGANFVRAFYSEFSHPVYYLPAARGGILQSHKALASVAIQRSPLIGIEPLHIDRLTGVVTDFISLLLLMENSGQGDLSDIATYLEGNALQGTISLDSQSLEYPEIYYRPQAGQFPIYRTSSMVSELAPVVLLLKYVLRPHDTLIIEEPESHLHPAIQRTLARAIVRLVRKGVRVIITTHSDYFLNQLNNCISLARLSAQERTMRGYDDESFIAADEVAAYLFTVGLASRGSSIKALSVDPYEGISDEAFAEVTESLYSETLDLQHELLGST